MSEEGIVDHGEVHKRTGPELRGLVRLRLLELYAEVDYKIEEFLEEMTRRSPTRKVARRRDPDPNPKMIVEIRKYAAKHPEASYKFMAHEVFDTSTRVISLALRGKRDGSPIFDNSGYRIRKKREKPQYADLDEDDILS